MSGMKTKNLHQQHTCIIVRKKKDLEREGSHSRQGAQQVRGSVAEGELRPVHSEHRDEQVWLDRRLRRQEPDSAGVRSLWCPYPILQATGGI